VLKEKGKTAGDTVGTAHPEGEENRVSLNYIAKFGSSNSWTLGGKEANLTRKRRTPVRIQNEVRIKSVF